MEVLNRSCCCDVPFPFDSILDAVFTVSPNKQYLGIVIPTTPATTGPVPQAEEKVNIISY